MSKTFGICGIPHYALIDKEGKLIDKNAPRPSSGDAIIDLVKSIKSK